MPLFRQYLKNRNVIWRILYAKIWKGEDDVDADEMFWYLQIPNLRGRLEPFHRNLQNRVQTITDLHKYTSNTEKLLDHPLSEELFIQVSPREYTLNTEVLTSIARCFIVFMHLEDVCSFNGVYVRDMWDLLKECVSHSSADFSNTIIQSKKTFERL